MAQRKMRCQSEDARSPELEIVTTQEDGQSDDLQLLCQDMEVSIGLPGSLWGRTVREGGGSIGWWVSPLSLGLFT